MWRGGGNTPKQASAGGGGTGGKKPQPDGGGGGGGGVRVNPHKGYKGARKNLVAGGGKKIHVWFMSIV